jgi:hypothetical protein
LSGPSTAPSARLALTARRYRAVKSREPQAVAAPVRRPYKRALTLGRRPSPHHRSVTGGRRNVATGHCRWAQRSQCADPARRRRVAGATVNCWRGCRGERHIAATIGGHLARRSQARFGSHRVRLAGKSHQGPSAEGGPFYCPRPTRAALACAVAPRRRAHWRASYAQGAPHKSKPQPAGVEALERCNMPAHTGHEFARPAAALVKAASNPGQVNSRQ